MARERKKKRTLSSSFRQENKVNFRFPSPHQFHFNSSSSKDEEQQQQQKPKKDRRACLSDGVTLLLYANQLES
jgi:hypothetical protein